MLIEVNISQIAETWQLQKWKCGQTWSFGPHKWKYLGSHLAHKSVRTSYQNSTMVKTWQSSLQCYTEYSHMNLINVSPRLLAFLMFCWLSFFLLFSILFRSVKSVSQSRDILPESFVQAGPAYDSFSKVKNPLVSKSTCYGWTLWRTKSKVSIWLWC